MQILKSSNHNNIRNKYAQSWQTGAMYSSVPTKEFDARIGSAIKIGFGWPFRFFFFSTIVGIKSCKKKHNQSIMHILMCLKIYWIHANIVLCFKYLYSPCPEKIYAKQDLITRIPVVCKTSNMTNQNLSRTHAHCSGVKHFQASNPCKLSL